MRSPLAASTQAELRTFLGYGLSIVAVARDENMVPAFSRCGAARFGDDGTLRVLVAMPEGGRLLDFVDATHAIALSVVRPTNYRTFQIKGTDAHRIAWPDHEAVAIAHRLAFQREVAQLGLSKTMSGNLWSRTFVPIAFTPLDVFDQTPGPTAGLAVAP